MAVITLPQSNDVKKNLLKAEDYIKISPYAIGGGEITILKLVLSSEDQIFAEKVVEDIEDILGLAADSGDYSNLEKPIVIQVYSDSISYVTHEVGGVMASSGLAISRLLTDARIAGLLVSVSSESLATLINGVVRGYFGLSLARIKPAEASLPSVIDGKLAEIIAQWNRDKDNKSFVRVINSSAYDRYTTGENSAKPQLRRKPGIFGISYFPYVMVG